MVKKSLLMLLIFVYILHDTTISFATEIDNTLDESVENTTVVEQIQEEDATTVFSDVNDENIDLNYSEDENYFFQSNESEIIDTNNDSSSVLFTIQKQPMSASGYIGDEIYFTTDVEGEDLKFQWYFTADSLDKWYQCKYYYEKDTEGNLYKSDYVGIDSNTLKMRISKNNLAYKYKCVITNGNEEKLETDLVDISIKEPVISSQSEDVINFIDNDNLDLFVDVMGSNLYYRWFESSDGGSTWRKTYITGYTSNHLFINDVRPDYDGYKYYCQIKDAYGHLVNSKIITIKSNIDNEETQDFSIISQPQNVSGYIGDEISFSAEATGSNLKYQWFFTAENLNKWYSCKYYYEKDANGKLFASDYYGTNSNTLQMRIAKNILPYKYKCIISNDKGEVLETNVVNISIKKPEILSQSDGIIEYLDNSNVNLFVEVLGSDLYYRWYESSDKGQTWKKTFIDGYASDKLLLANLNIECDGKQYYCQIKDAYGNTVNSDVMMLNRSADSNLFSFYSDEEITTFERNVILSYDRLLESMTIDDANGKICFDISNMSVNEEDVYIFSFSAQCLSKCTNIGFRVNGDDNQFYEIYPIQVYEQNYVLPLIGLTNIDSISLELNENNSIRIGNFELSTLGKANISDYQVGIFARNNAETLIDYESGIGYMATDSLVDGEYMYTIYQGTLLVYSLQQPDYPQIISSLSGLGDTRELAITNDGKTLFVSSRVDGVFLVDVSNPYNVVLTSNIDTLGLATGIAITGDYCFICSRRHGVEIYNISNTIAPKFCSQIYSENKEMYDCSISNGFLYVSLWAEKKINIYDLSNIYNPVFIADIQLDGNAAGSMVVNGKLYVATGYNSNGYAKSPNNLNFGMGNGMEIYDVENPHNPKWLSTTKLDSRYYISGFDHWRVIVSENIAYVINAYNGVYVYDVSDCQAPKRLEKITIRIPSGHYKYKVLQGNNFLLPYNQNEYTQSLVTSVTPVDGKLYITTHTGDKYKSLEADVLRNSRTGLYVLNRDYAYRVSKNDFKLDGESILIEQHYRQFDEDYTYNIVSTSSNVRGIAEVENNLLIAAGSKGIQVYNIHTGELKELTGFKTVNSIIAIDNYVYVAENGVGVRGYLWNGDNLELIDKCIVSMTDVVNNMHLSKNNNYIIAQNGLYNYIIMDISTRNEIKIIENTYAGGMYYKNISNDLTNSGIVGISARNSLIFYNENENKELEKINEINNKYYLEDAGITGYGDYVIQIYTNGYVYYNPEELTDDNISNVATRVRIEGLDIKGCPKVVGNKLYICDYLGRKITILDITDINKPVLLNQVSFEFSLDNIYSIDDKIIIPLAHQGFLVLKEKE